MASRTQPSAFPEARERRLRRLAKDLGLTLRRSGNAWRLTDPRAEPAPASAGEAQPCSLDEIEGLLGLAAAVAAEGPVITYRPELAKGWRTIAG